MARRHPIDPDELFETANRLVAEGKEVTATALLDALGGGSLRTIYKYLEQWKDKAPIAPVKKKVDIPDRVQASFSMAWRMATDEAAIEIEAVKQKAAEVNLQNARLYYTTQALTSKELNTRQKDRIVESLAKAKTIEETKLVYETMKDSVGSTNERTAPESLSEAVNRTRSLVVSSHKREDKQAEQSPMF